MYGLCCAAFSLFDCLFICVLHLFVFLQCLGAGGRGRDGQKLIFLHNSIINLAIKRIRVAFPGAIEAKDGSNENKVPTILPFSILSLSVCPGF